MVKVYVNWNIRLGTKQFDSIYGTASVQLTINSKEKTATKIAFSGLEFYENRFKLSSRKELLQVLYLDEHFVDEFEG
jgi:hypothetical protein